MSGTPNKRLHEESGTHSSLTRFTHPQDDSSTYSGVAGANAKLPTPSAPSDYHAVSYDIGQEAHVPKVPRTELDSTRSPSRLFGLINELPAVSEVVREWAPADKPRKDHSSEASGSKPRSSGVKRSSDGKGTSTENIIEEGSEEEEEDVKCGSCGFVNKGNEFWIKCDVCGLWYHGKCVGITSAVAKNIGKYECPSCENK